MKVKEFNNEISVEKVMNAWLTKHSDKKILDIKYSADKDGANALIIYED